MNGKLIQIGKSPYWKISITYFITASAWIFFSDKITFENFSDFMSLQKIQLIKGIFFVFGSSLLIFFVGKKFFDEILNKNKKIAISENKYKGLFDNINVGIATHKIITDSNNKPIDFIFLDVNPEYEKLTGLKLDEIKGKRGKEIIPNLEHKWIDLYGKVALDGESISVENHSNYLNKYWSVKAFSYEKDHFVIAISDITERKQHEILLKKEKEKTEEINQKVEGILDAIPDLIFILNEKAVIVDYHTKNESNLLLPPESFINKNIEDVIPEEVQDLTKQTINKVLSTKQTTDYSYRLFINNEKKYFEARMSYLGPNRVLSLIRDITEQRKAEIRIKENEQMLMEAQKIAKLGHYSFDIKKGTWENSQVLDEIFGIDGKFEKSVSGWLNIVHPDFREEMENHLKIDVLTNQEEFNKEYKIIDQKNRDEKWVYGHGKLEFDRESNPTRMFGIIQDITDRKETEIALNKSEERYKLAIEGTQDGLWDLNLITNEAEFSKRYETMLGYEPGELPRSDKAWTNLLHPDDVQQAHKNLFNYLNGKTEKYESTFRMRAKNGSYKWIAGRGKATFDENNIPLRITGFNTDITDRKNAELALKVSENKFKTLFESMTEMVALHELVFNDNGEVINYRIIDCNKAYSDIIGIDKKGAINKLATEVYKLDEPPYLKEFSNVAITGENYEYTTYFEPMDKYFMISVVSPGKNTFATITTDITAIKQIEMVVKAKNKELENYLYVASHDLRSPLVNVQGFSQIFNSHAKSIKKLIEETSIETEIKEQIDAIIDSKIPETLDFIFNSVEKMDTLIKGLLKISRTGRQEMLIREIDMNELIENVLKNYSYRLDDINANITVEDLPRCYGDKDLINQLFSNLIDNAIKFRDSDKNLNITIKGRTHYKKAIYSINDNGIGIAKNHLNKIWDVFFQVNYNALTSGEGIGLSLVKRIVDKHKGKIEVQSNDKKGTTFYVELLRNKFLE